MLSKFGYKTIHEAYDGAEAVRQMERHRGDVDVVLMDLWMPYMDGYEATEKILSMPRLAGGRGGPTVLAVSADVTDAALKRAAKVGMKGFMTKPFKLHDLQRLILEYCSQQGGERVDGVDGVDGHGGGIDQQVVVDGVGHDAGLKGEAGVTAVACP